MRKLLILGAGAMQIPAYHAARDLGLGIIAIDPSPEAPARALADAAFCHDLRDFDACLAVARDQQVQGVMTLAADYPIPAVAELCEALQLPGLKKDAVSAVTHKGEMLRRLAAAGLPVPRTVEVATADKALAAIRHLGGETILKPVDSSGGRGVTSCAPGAADDELLEAFERAAGYSLCGRVIVSECVQGPEFSVESLTHTGRTTIVAITEKLTSGPPYHVEIGHSQPPRAESSVVARLEQVTRDAVTALGIDDSPAHTEIRLTPTGPSLIEVGARLGGGFITSDLVPLSSGIDLVRAAVQLAVGDEPELTPRRPGGPRGAAMRFLTPPPGKVRAIRGEDAARQSPGVQRLVVGLSVGEWVEVLKSAIERNGYVICDGADAESAIRNAERARDLVHIETE